MTSKSQRFARASLCVTEWMRMRLGLLLRLGFLVVSLSSSGRADPSPETDTGTIRLVVARFAGRAATIPRAGVVAALENEPSVDLLSVRLLEKRNDLLDGTEEGDAQAAQSLGVLAILRGRVRDIPGGHELVLTVVDGETGKPMARLIHESSTLDQMRRELSETLWSMLDPVFRVLTSPVETRPPRAPSNETSNERTAQPRHASPTSLERASPPPAPKVECAATELAPGAGVLLRSFGYQHKRSGALRGYQMSPVPVVALRAAVRPFAWHGCGAAARLAFVASHEHALGVTSRVPGGKLDTMTFHSYAELAYSIPVGALSIVPSLGYDIRVFTVALTLVPDVDYQSGRFSLNLELDLDPLLVQAGGSGKMLVKKGSFGSPTWFENAEGYGYEAVVGLGLRVAAFLDVLVNAGVERYRFRLDTSEDDPLDADSASDEFSDWMLWLGFHPEAF